ncbi:OLC1v1015797C1 [Oldenlandia corymbosa var. corymbosa]|uniref:OLC1v1015797C1 n=1 Tax=Oldenlandia corymbosa var. corymbosa TaxID=529605 RepID=A0AAV1E3Y4_OLDCO|nr:OLC1v1015797C1 [Oldenlandia corymbosa var. corymbosa]
MAVNTQTRTFASLFNQSNAAIPSATINTSVQQQFLDFKNVSFFNGQPELKYDDDEFEALIAPHNKMTLDGTALASTVVQEKQAQTRSNKVQFKITTPVPKWKSKRSRTDEASKSRLSEEEKQAVLIAVDGVLPLKEQETTQTDKKGLNSEPSETTDTTGQDLPPTSPNTMISATFSVAAAVDDLLIGRRSSEPDDSDDPRITWSDGEKDDVKIQETNGFTVVKNKRGRKMNVERTQLQTGLEPRRYKASIIVLLEPMLDAIKIDRIRVELGYAHAYSSCSSKIWFFSTNALAIQLLGGSEQSLHFKEWIDTFPVASVEHLNRTTSDHCLLLLQYRNTEETRPKSFCFQKMWLPRPEFLKVVEENWNMPLSQSGMLGFSLKLRRSKLRVKTWNKENIGNAFDNLKKVEDKSGFMCSLQSLRQCQYSINSSSAAKNSYGVVLKKEKNTGAPGIVLPTLWMKTASA